MIVQLVLCALLAVASAAPQQQGLPASTSRLQPQQYARFAPQQQQFAAPPQQQRFAVAPQPQQFAQFAPAAVQQQQAPLRRTPVVVRRPVVRPGVPADIAFRDELRDDFKEDDQLNLDSQYSFGFGVNDDLYNNVQTRTETRDGQRVTGSYSIVDSDGFIRKVEYVATPEGGFQAKVSREPTDIRVHIPEPVPLEQSADGISRSRPAPALPARPPSFATVVRAPSIGQVPQSYTSASLGFIQNAQLGPAPIYSYSEPGVNVAVRVPTFQHRPVTISRSA